MQRRNLLKLIPLTVLTGAGSPGHALSVSNTKAWSEDVHLIGKYVWENYGREFVDRQLSHLSISDNSPQAIEEQIKHEEKEGRLIAAASWYLPETEAAVTAYYYAHAENLL